MAWRNSSGRTAPLPSNWRQIRRAVLRRDAYRCAETALDSVEERCPYTATEVDHIGNPEDHTFANLRALCTWHHRRRTAQQGATAANAKRQTRKRPAEPHPGLRMNQE